MRQNWLNVAGSLIGLFICGSCASSQQAEIVVPEAKVSPPKTLANGRPNLIPLPEPQKTWECEVVVMGGSLGGVAAAYHAMEAGATTC